jgi:4-hydroxybenzoate polyprenyltransferase
MSQDLKGAASFISVERGLMLFMISVAATFLIAEIISWPAALFLGFTVFCVWSAVDAMNNVCDVELDTLSDPLRAKYTKRLGKVGLLVVYAFVAISLLLGAVTQMPIVFLFVALGLFFGVLYSVPPFRLRQTKYKPLVNFTVGAIPILIVAAFFSVYSIEVAALVLLIGATTAINSLWEDLADYDSDSANNAQTMTVVLVFRNGVLFAVVMGYALIPLMVLVGMLFQLSPIYYFTLVVLAALISFRLFRERHTLLKKIEPSSKRLLQLGNRLAKDFVIIALLFTASLMISSLLKISPIFF